MKRLSRIAFIVLFAVALTGCKKDKETELRVSEAAQLTNEPETTEEAGETAQPLETKTEEAEPSGTEEDQGNQDLKQVGLNNYVNLEDAADSADSVIHEKQDNVLFRQDFEVSVPKELGEYQLEQSSTFNKDGESVPKYFLGDKFNKKFLSLNKNQEMKSYIYEDKSNHIQIGTSENGYCNYENGEISWLSQEDAVQKWIFVRGEYDEDTVYKVKDGKMTIPQALECGQKYVSQYVQKYGDLSWTPLMVAIMQEKDGTYGFEIYYTPAYKDVNFCYLYDSIVADLLDEEIDCFSDIDIATNRIYINSTEGIARLCNIVGAINYKKTEKTYDQIISFEQAVKIVENNIKDGTNHNITSAQIEYLLSMEKYANKERGYGQNSGDLYRTKPYWVFYMGNDQNEVPETSVVVDCITGECYQTSEDGSSIYTLIEQN